MNATELLASLIGVAVVFYALWPKPKRAPKTRAQIPQEHVGLPRNPIVLDGSNVMHWGGDPTAKALNHVIGKVQEKGFSPIVIFDASAGYRLSDRFMTEADFARLTSLPNRQLLVVNKGVVADEVILDFAQEHSLRIVTNDRYRDWAGRFPLVKDNRRLIKGTFKEGHVKLPSL